LLWLLVRPGPAAQPRRPEILRLATAYELYGGLRQLTAAARGPIMVLAGFYVGFRNFRVL